MKVHLKLWFWPVFRFHLYFALIFCFFVQPGMLIYLVLLPPALLLTFEIWLFHGPEVLAKFPFLAIPAMIGVVSCLVSFPAVRYGISAVFQRASKPLPPAERDKLDAMLDIIGQAAVLTLSWIYRYRSDISVVLALWSGAIAFIASGDHYVARLQKQEALRLGASCITSRGFATDVRSLQYWDAMYLSAHASIVVDGQTYLWSYKKMTFSRLYPRPLRACRPTDS